MSDAQMIVRGSEEGYINLSVGEPFFLQEAFRAAFGISLGAALENFAYPTFGGQQVLLDELAILHPGKEIVVTNGGKQALLAAMYAFAKQEQTSPTVVHRQPYWPSYPTLASLSGLGFSTTVPNSPHIRINTTPNNPDGGENLEACDIYDAAYAHPMYGAYSAPPCVIAVHSASKVYGLSGFRVGWIVTENKGLADLARLYVEITTSGVSSLSQQTVAEFLSLLRSNPDKRDNMYHLGRNTLMHNAMVFNEILGDHCEQIKGLPDSLTGMFAFFKAKDPTAFDAAAASAKVRMVSGESCGAPEPGWYRMSMGHTLATTEKGIAALGEELRRLDK